MEIQPIDLLPTFLAPSPGYKASLSVRPTIMSVVIRTARNAAASVGTSIEHTTNRLLPQKQRERALENLRAFCVRNPKLAVSLDRSDQYA